MMKKAYFCGVSGSGKSTVVVRVAEHYRREGFNVREIREPGPLARQALQYRHEPDKDPYIELALFTADRQLTRMIEENEKPPDIALFDRGPPDTMVYQGMLGGIPLHFIMKMNKRFLDADAYLLYTVAGHVGRNRAHGRDAETLTVSSANERADRIDERSRYYRRLPDFLPNATIIDTTHLDPDGTLEKTIEVLEAVVR